MKDRLIKDWMTADPVIITPDTNMSDAHALMRKHRIRRLPVVDNRQRLVGIVSLSDIHEAEPSDATSLSVHEMTYLLSNLLVKEIMTTMVHTVNPEQTMAEAARMMMELKIGGLPVVEGGKLVGILTESDIFRMVVELYA
ncbi:MAG: hypothetical protein OHK0046_42600 [Anaerolineae bacterium]